MFSKSDQNYLPIHYTQCPPVRQSETPHENSCLYFCLSPNSAHAHFGPRTKLPCSSNGAPCVPCCRARRAASNAPSLVRDRRARFRDMPPRSQSSTPYKHTVQVYFIYFMIRPETADAGPYKIPPESDRNHFNLTLVPTTLIPHHCDSEKIPP